MTDFTRLGTFNVTIIVAAGRVSTIYPINVTITNSAPVFSTIPLSSTSLYVGESKNYKLPSIIDDEGHSPVISYSIPNKFITFNNVDLFVFTNPAIADIGTYTVGVNLSDYNMQSSYNFTVKVMTKPAFDNGTTLFPDVTVALNSVKSFSVPSFSDVDLDSVTISIAEGSGGTLPNFIKLKNKDALVEAAPIAFTDVKIHNVKLVLTTVNEAVSYPFKINVTNTAPTFSNTPLAS